MMRRYSLRLYVTLIFSVSMIIVNIVPWIDVSKSGSKLRKKILTSLQMQSKKVESTCQSEYDKFTIHENPLGAEDDVACQRAPIDPETSCLYMKEILQKEKNECTQVKMHVEICRQPRKWSQEGGNLEMLEFNCNFAYVYCLSAQYAVLNDSTGDLSWSSVDPKQLEPKMKELYKSNLHNFVFLACKVKKVPDSKVFWPAMSAKPDGFVIHDIEQMVYFVHPPEGKGSPADGEKMNVNVLFVDSLSRTGVYRSMPNMITFLQQLNQDNPGRVLDYHLMQSMFTGTYWNLENMWMGDDAKQTIDNEFYMFEIAFLGKKFQQAGYGTASLHDTCYHWPWRNDEDVRKISKKKRLAEFRRRQSKSYLNTTGITLATCQILNGSLNSFKAFTSKHICYNGKFEVEYQIANIKDLQLTWHQTQHPFFTFMETNINHNRGVSRVMQLDPVITDYLKDMESAIPNLLTIIFSDHGNRFDPNYIVEYFPEGRTDIMHPFAFVILPKNRKKYFSETELETLTMNQRRMTTVRDIHYLIRKFADEEGRGKKEEAEEPSSSLLTPIPKERSCKSLAGKTKGYFTCICKTLPNETFAIESEQETEKLLSFMKTSLNGRLGDTSGKECLNLTDHLELWSPKRIHRHFDRLTYTESTVEAYLVLNYEYADNQGKTEEHKVVFGVHVRQSRDVLSLHSFMRLDEYGDFKRCIPRGIDIRICICNPHKPIEISTSSSSS